MLNSTRKFSVCLIKTRNKDKIQVSEEFAKYFAIVEGIGKREHLWPSCEVSYVVFRSNTELRFVY